MKASVRREIVATLIKQGRRDLARQFVGAGDAQFLVDELKKFSNWQFQLRNHMKGWIKSVTKHGSDKDFVAKAKTVEQMMSKASDGLSELYRDATTLG